MSVIVFIKEDDVLLPGRCGLAYSFFKLPGEFSFNKQNIRQGFYNTIPTVNINICDVFRYDKVNFTQLFFCHVTNTQPST